MPKIASERTAGGGVMMGTQLIGFARCPHCLIAKPNMIRAWGSPGQTPRTDGGPGTWWAAYHCAACGGIILAKGVHTGNEFAMLQFFPSPKAAHEDIPETARKYLQQAFETLHAPDAAVVMAGSAVDAMLKHYAYKDASLYARIDQALEDNLLTKGMADWAHEVRLGSNRPRHSDEKNPHVSADEAKQAVEFAEALGNFLFVLTARIERGLKAAKKTDPAKTD